MTDDPRLEAVTKAWSDFCGNEAPEIARERARFYCAMIRAFLGEDAERKEVNHPATQDNATAPVAAGADPPWPSLQAECAAALHKAGGGDLNKVTLGKLVDAVLRVANAQPPSNAEVEAAHQLILGYLGTYLSAAVARAALEAAAKVRVGG